MPTVPTRIPLGKKACIEGLYEDYTNKLPWNEKFMTFPYPSEQLNKSAGKLKNPPSWQ